MMAQVPTEPADHDAAANCEKAIAGLSSDEARRRLAMYGPNAVRDPGQNAVQRFVTKLWAPVPWLLELAIVVQLAAGEYVEAAIIAVLLLFNVVLGFLQESKAQGTLAALKSRLALSSLALRDAAWRPLPAAELVPGDVVKLSLGCVVPADVRVVEGEVLLDQSMLTGESVPIEVGPGEQSYAGALVCRGEAVVVITATGGKTRFGKTAELVRAAHVVSSQQKAVFAVIRNLFLVNSVIVVLLVSYAHLVGLSRFEVLSLLLTAILATIPVALPATFALAAAIAARSLTQRGVLPTRLSAVDEAASIDLLCADKTGTLTQNHLAVTRVVPMKGYTEQKLLQLASLASSTGSQDPVEQAIRAAAVNDETEASVLRVVQFVPFDPHTKASEAILEGGPTPRRIVKGAFASVLALTEDEPMAADQATELELQGYRVLAVADGYSRAMRLAGIIALSDLPRSDSVALIAELKQLGVRTLMVTGDAPATAVSVARALQLSTQICPVDQMRAGRWEEQVGVFAGVLPEDKYQIVKSLQQHGHVVGMCGDGANDAPALRQAQFGIAVSTATDVAKSAAGIVLTEPGLGGIVDTIREGRKAFQRILTYTLNSLIKKMVQVLLLAIGLVMTGHAILTPMLMVIVMLTNDFLTMALATDSVRPSTGPNQWRIGNLTLAAAVLAGWELAFCASVLVIGQFWLHLPIEKLRTIALIALVFASQATLFSIRERRLAWSSCPSGWLLLSSAVNLLIISVLATCGVAMAAVPTMLLLAVLAAAAIFFLVVDSVKVTVLNRLQIS